MEQKITTSLIKGLVIFLVLAVYSLVLGFIGESQNRALGAIQILLLFGGIIYSCMLYSKEMNHNVTFGNVFGHGFKVVATITALFVVYSIISIKFIFPEQIDLAMDKAREQMSANPQMTESQMDQAIEFSKKYFVPLAAASITFAFAIFGAIAALIGAAVAKKNPQTPFNQ